MTITFTIPDALRNDYAFDRPAFDAESSPGGEELRRCYSICRSRSPSEISVTVKAIDGGRFSRHAQQDIQQRGMALEVMVPQGTSATSRRPSAKPNIWRLPPGPALRR